MKKTAKKDKKNTKKETKRSKKPTQKTRPKKLWGLERLTFPKAVQQYLDQDYISTLNDEEKQWLSKFNNEYYGNTLNKDWRKNLHLKEQKKAIFDQTNARNRDIFNNRYKFNENESGIPIPDSYSEYANPEQTLIDAIYIEKEINKFRKQAIRAKTEKKFIDELIKVVFDII